MTVFRRVKGTLKAYFDIVVAVDEDELRRTGVDGDEDGSAIESVDQAAERIVAEDMDDRSLLLMAGEDVSVEVRDTDIVDGPADPVPT